MRQKVFFYLLCVFLNVSAIAIAQEECESVRLVQKDLDIEHFKDYQPVFEACTTQDRSLLAIRRMKFDNEVFLLTVDPISLETRLERDRCLSCAQTQEQEYASTRFFQALNISKSSLFNAGLTHGAGGGVYLTGDLCPSGKPLDRSFIEEAIKFSPGAPLALAVSGAWLVRHKTDFAWLLNKVQDQELKITWVNHSYTHPYISGLPDRQNYLLKPGVELDQEIFETEKQLILQGAVPSVFFRFPGLVADEALQTHLRSRHLIALGADAWLVLAPAPRPGSIVLVHPNGNEPQGLRLFSKYLQDGKMPLPFRSINEAP